MEEESKHLFDDLSSSAIASPDYPLMKLTLSGASEQDGDEDCGSPMFQAFIKHRSSDIESVQESINKVILLELGGFHGQLEPQIYKGELGSGASYITTKIKEVRQKNLNAIVIAISTGDFFTGPELASELKGEPVIKFLNMAKFDVMVLGHHDFDKGQEILSQRLAEAEFPIVVSNLVYEKNGEHISSMPHPLSIVKPCLFLEKKGKTILVIGLMKPDAANFQLAENIEGLQWISAKSAVKRIILSEAYSSHKPDIIAIFYKNIDESKELIWYLNSQIKKRLLLRLPFVVFIGGDKAGYGQIKEANYTIFPGSCRGYQIGKVQIELRWRTAISKGEFLKISCDKIVPDVELQKMLDEYKKRLPKENKIKIGYCVKPLTKQKEIDCSLGILIAEAMKKAGHADASFLSSGTIKQEIQAGELTLADIKAAVPFSDRVYLLDISGENISLILEQSAKLEADAGSGGKVLQMAGIRMVYNIRKEKGKRVEELSINSETIDPKREYRVAVSEYLVKGGDCFAEFKKCKILMEIGVLHDIIATYIKSKLKGVVDIEADHRIVQLS